MFFVVVVVVVSSVRHLPVVDILLEYDMNTPGELRFRVLQMWEILLPR